MKRRRGKFGIKRAYFAFPYAFLSVLFVVIPLMILVVYAFRTEDGSFSFSNFSMGTKEWRAMGRSFYIAFLTTVVCLLISYPLALALCNLCKNRTATLVMLFVLPMWINSLLRIYAIKLLFSEFIELFNQGTMFTLVGMVYDFFPFMLLPIYTSLSNTETGLIEAAGDLGASPIKTLFKVRLPLSVPGIVSGVLMVFMPTVSTFAVSSILGGPDLFLFGNIIEEQFKLGYLGSGAAYSFILLILIMLSVVGANLLTKRKDGSGHKSNASAV